jgi:hypothetical protein
VIPVYFLVKENDLLLGKFQSIFSEDLPGSGKKLLFCSVKTKKISKI